MLTILDATFVLVDSEAGDAGDGTGEVRGLVGEVEGSLSGVFRPAPHSLFDSS